MATEAEASPFTAGVKAIQASERIAGLIYPLKAAREMAGLVSEADDRLEPEAGAIVSALDEAFERVADAMQAVSALLDTDAA